MDAAVTDPDHLRAAAERSRSTPFVFIVDDDVSVRESLESLIRSAGWQARTFGPLFPAVRIYALRIGQRQHPRHALLLQSGSAGFESGPRADQDLLHKLQFIVGERLVEIVARQDQRHGSAGK